MNVLNRAYEISIDGTPQTSYSEENLEFVRKTLLERSELLAKIKHIQATSIESQKIINAFQDQDHPAFHEAVERFHHLRELKLSLIEQFMDNIQQEESPIDVDLAAPAEEVVTQAARNVSRRNSENVHSLYEKIHSLTAMVSRLENEFVTQQTEFSHMLEEQAQLQTRNAKQDLMLEQQGAQIQKLEDFAETFKMAQEELEVIVHRIEDKGIEDTNRVLTQISGLKRNLVSVLPVDFDLDEYQSGFFYTLKQDLIAMQNAASLVTNTNIIRNSKTGAAGRAGDMLDIAGDLIPTIGGCVQFMAAIINTLDHTRQQTLVTKLASIARTPSEMERIAHTIAKILSDPQYFDKSMIESQPQSLKGKIMGYTNSFIEELSDGTQSSTVNAVEGTVHHPKEKSPTKKKGFMHFRHKSLPDDDLATEAASSTQSFEFMSSSRSNSESPKQLTSTEESSVASSKKGFGWIVKARKSGGVPQNDKIVISEEEQTGINNAHLISKTIINLIFEDLIPSRSSQATEYVITEKILTAIFAKLDLDPTRVPTILSEELPEPLELSPRSSVSPVPLSEEKLEAKKLAKEILNEVAKQVEIPDKLYNAALHALTSRLNTCKHTYYRLYNEKLGF